MSIYRTFEGFVYESKSVDFDDRIKNVLEVIRSERIFTQLKISADYRNMMIERIEEENVLGFCERDGHITISNELIKDFDFMRFVYVHELTHRFFFGHSSNFGILNLIMLARHNGVSSNEAFKNPYFSLYCVQDSLVPNQNVGLNLPCALSGFDFGYFLATADELNRSNKPISWIAEYLNGFDILIYS